jgi:hypothetical protein
MLSRTLVDLTHQSEVLSRSEPVGRNPEFEWFRSAVSDLEGRRY